MAERPRRVLELLGPSSGGIRRHVAVLGHGLQERGWSVAVAGPAGVMDGVGRQDHAVPVPDGLSPAGAWSARRRLGPLATEFDLIHAHGMKAGWVAATLRPRPPLVVTLHNVVLDEVAGRRAGVLRALERRLPARTDRTIAVSSEIARRFSGSRGADRIMVVAPAGHTPRPGRPPAAVRESLGVGAAAPLVVVVARHHPQKDLSTMLRAAAELRDAVAGVKVVLVGDGPLRSRLEAEAAGLGLAGTVTFAGWSENAADEMAAADVVAMSSSWEGSPLVAAEALLLGRPLVATAVGAVPEVVVDGETGRLVPVGDPHALAAAVAQMLADPAAAARMAAAGREAAEARFSVSVLVDRVADVYRSVLEER